MLQFGYPTYHDNGQLCSEINYINDKMNGINKSYLYNGQLQSETNCIDGKRNGYKSYSMDGQLEYDVLV